MPFIRVNCPKKALSPDRRPHSRPRLVQALIRQELDPPSDASALTRVN
jgi:hypothetical protein